jgi:hypothetical protein
MTIRRRRRNAIFVVIACTGGCSTGDPPPVPTNAPTAQASINAAPSGVISASLDAGVPPDSGALDTSYAIAIPVPPATTCSVRPKGAATGSQPSDTLYSGRESEVRFYSPSAEWGTQLTLTCTTNGTPQGTYNVDLNDDATFLREPQSALSPTLVGTRPALSGDLSSFSRTALLQAGYPPRPDPSVAPKEYSQWVSEVTKPVDLYRPIVTAELGQRFGTGIPWSGFVQSQNDFGSGGTTGSSTLYTFYIANLTVPYGSCPSGNCLTGLWAGIGGWPTAFFSGFITTQVIQSGVSIMKTGVAVPWYEFTTNGPKYPSVPSGDKYNSGDTLQLWGWQGDSNCAPDSNGGYGCFEIYDVTNNWSYPTGFVMPSGGVFIPTTAEYVAELGARAGVQNGAYFLPSITGYSEDQNYKIHWDPGNANATDAYIVTTQTDSSGNPLNKVEWANGTQNSSVDPIFFLWENYN